MPSDSLLIQEITTLRTRLSEAEAENVRLKAKLEGPFDEDNSFDPTDANAAMDSHEQMLRYRAFMEGVLAANNGKPPDRRYASAALNYHVQFGHDSVTKEIRKREEAERARDGFKYALAQVGSYFDTEDDMSTCGACGVMERRQKLALEAIGLTAWEALDYCAKNPPVLPAQGKQSPKEKIDG